MKYKAIIIIMVTLLANSFQNMFADDEDYTLGIGKYPGDRKENFSPMLMKDNSYRNLALNRIAYHSSSYDYNLTAQLITDGIKAKGEPAYIEVSTSGGKLMRREREWSIDGGEYTRNILIGDRTYLQYDWHNMSVKAERITIRFNVAYHEKYANKGYRLTCLTSENGIQWKTIGEKKERVLPGKETKWKAHSDPNKVTDSELLPNRIVETTIDLNGIKEFSHLKIEFEMEGAAHWTVTEVKMFEGERYVTEILPSRHFSSSWMSAEGGTQWVYVDLGDKADFDKILLHWINKARKGQIEVSDDAKNWKTIASLPGGKSKTDEIKLHGNARFVRVLMYQNDVPDRYILSEIEIMGRGGLVARHKNEAGMLNGKYMLDGGSWRMQRASEISGNGESISKAGFDVTDWIAATVPATVLSSYVNIGAVPDPNYDDNLFYVSESFFYSDFWYRKEFEVPQSYEGKHVFLNFDGINWKAVVWLNGNRIGTIEGAFIRGRCDITHFLNKGKNVIAVEIICNEHPGAVKEKNAENTDFNGGLLGADNPTFHATVGWDWISTIRGRNIGIWNDVYLSATGSLSIRDPLVVTELSGKDNLATVTPSVFVVNNEPHDVTAVLKGRIGSINFEQEITISANTEREFWFSPEQFTQLKDQHMKLWWPNGYGEPYLYDAAFTISVDGICTDSLNFKAGIREVTYSDIGTKLKMYVNGRRFIPLGGNWGFSENNLNYRGREYDIAVGYHRDMNFNMIRNWVGQTGDVEFYEACDRYGIMVWQDFWLANPADGPDPNDEQMFLNNAFDYVKRIRNHACIGIYCGRNEGYPPATLDRELRKYVKILHEGMEYISSSADEGVSGHGPYRALQAKEYFERQTGKLHSERGMPNVMTYEGLARTISSDALIKHGDKWGQHDYTMQGAQQGASFNALINDGFGAPDNTMQFCSLAQWINYNGYRAMFESCSRDRMGLLIWMSHPCWPTMVWQTYDYYFEPTAAYFGCKKACEPLHIQYNAATDSAEVVNLCAGRHENLKAIAEIFNADGRKLLTKEKKIASDNDTNVSVTAVKVPTEINGSYYLKLRLFSATDSVLSENFYVLSTKGNDFKDLNTLPETSLQTNIEWGNNCGTMIIENNTHVPALMIRINLKADDGEQILPVTYSDNYFSLMPGDKKTVKIAWKKEDTRGCNPQIELSGFNIIQ